MRNRITTFFSKHNTSNVTNPLFNQKLSHEQKNEIKTLRQNLQQSVVIDLYQYAYNACQYRNIAYLEKVVTLLNTSSHLDAWLKLFFETLFNFTLPAAETTKENFIECMISQTDISFINPYYFLHDLIAYPHFNYLQKESLINQFYLRQRCADIKYCENPISFILNAEFKSKNLFHAEPNADLLYDVVDNLIKRLKSYSLIDTDYALLLTLFKVNKYRDNYHYYNWLNAADIVNVIDQMNLQIQTLNKTSTQSSPRKSLANDMIKIVFQHDYAYQANLCAVIDEQRRTNRHSLFHYLPRDVTQSYLFPMIMNDCNQNRQTLHRR